MKKWYLIPLLAICFLFGYNNVEAQCGYSSSIGQAGGTIIPTCGSDQSITMPGPNYYALFNVVAGGNYTVQTCSSANWDTRVDLYNNSSQAFIGTDDDGCGVGSGPSIYTFTSTFSGVVRVNVPYYGCPASPYNWFAGMTSAVLRIKENTAGNSTCAGAVAMTVGTSVTGHTTCTAASSPGTCIVGDNTSGGVWYTVVGNGNQFTASLVGGTSNFDTYLRVFSGSCGGLVCVNGNDDSQGTLQSTVPWCTTNGTTYYIYVNGFSTNSGNFTLSISQAALSTAPSGGVASNPTVCPGGSATLTATGGSLMNGASWVWYLGGCGSGTSVGSGAPVVTQSTTPATYFYYVRAEGGDCPTTTACGSAVSVTVVNNLTYLTNPADANICTGGNYNPTVSTTGGTGAISYQWQYCSTSGGTYTNVVNGTPAGAVYTNTTSATAFNVAGISAPGSYYYRCSATVPGSGCTTPVVSSFGTLNVAGQITFSSNPASSNICLGGTYSPTAAASGSYGTINYQWQYCATSGGTYTDVVNGTPAGSIYSNTTSPSAFSVTGFSTAGSYFYKCKATSTITNGGCTNPVSSTFATLNVANQLAFTTNPANANICVGGTYAPTVVTSGGQSVTYQWQYSSDNITFTNVVNGTPSGATYNNPTSASAFNVTGITAAGTYYYQCTASASGSNCTTPLNSASGTVNIANQISFTTNPGDGNICVGGTYSPTVATTGGQTVTYQWQYATTSGGSYTNVVNGTPAGAVYTSATSPTAFSVTGITAASTYYYKCQAVTVGNGCTTPVLSTFGTLIVANQIAFGTNPAAANICVGGTYSPTAAATGGFGTINYQWQYSSDNITYNDVVNGTPAGATYTNPTSASTFNVTGISTAGTYYYKCKGTSSIVGGNCTSPVSSAAGVLNVANQIVFATNPADGNICTGGTYNPTASTTGGQSVTYQWQYATTSGGAYSNVVNGTPAGAVYSNATSASTFSVTGISAAGTYYYKCAATSVGNGCSTPVLSTFGTLNVATQILFTTNPSNANICVGGTYSPTVVSSGSYGSLTYQWQYATTSGGTYTNVVNGTPAGATYNNPTSPSTFSVFGITASGSYFYKCQATASGTGSNCTSPVLSSFGTLSVANQLAFSTNPSSVNICVGGTYSPTVATTGGQSVTYQWQYSPDNITFTNVANGTPTGAVYANPTSATTFTTTGITAPGTYYYQCQASSVGNNCTTPVNSTSGTVNIASQLAFTTNPASATICVSGVYNPTVATSGGQSVTYQWQYCATSAGTYTNVVNGTPTGAVYANATSPTAFTASSITLAGTYFYKCVATAVGNGCTTPVTSTFGQLSVAAQLAFATNPAAANICVGGTYAPTASTTGGQNVTYQWQYSPDNITYTNVVSGTPTGVTYNNPTSASTFSAVGITTAGTYYYKCQATAVGSNCTTPVLSTAGTLSVANQLVFLTNPADANICVSGTYSPTVSTSGGQTVTYQWQYCATSGGTYTNVVAGTPTGATYTNPTSASAFVVGGITAAGTYYYKCVASSVGNGCTTPVASTFGTLNVASQIVFGTNPAAANICVGGTYSPTAASTGGQNVTYQWQYSTALAGTYTNVANGTPTGATYTNTTSASTFSVTGITAAGSYFYKCQATSTGSNCTSPVLSTGANLVVANQLAFSTNPASANICVAGTYAPTVATTGGQSVTYQWQYSPDNITFSNVANSTPTGAVYTNPTSATTFTTTGITAPGTYYYQCKASAVGNNCATPLNSSSGTLNVASQIAFTTNPSNGNICVGGSYSPTVATTGGQSLTYQWQYCTTSAGTYTNVVNGTPAGSVYTNATSPTTFNVTGITAASTYFYKCVATAVGNGCTTPVSSSFGTLVVAAQLAFATNPAAANICVGGTYSPTASTTGGQSVTYQWQYSPDNITYTNVTAGTPTGATYTNPTLAGTFSVSGITAAGTYYYKLQANSVGSSCTTPVLSSAGTLNVANQLSFTTNPADGNICTTGGSYAPTVVTTGGQSVTYQWQYATTSGGAYANVAAGTPTGAVYTNPTSATAFTITGITASGTYFYKCVATSVGNGCTTPVSSTFSTLTVAPQVTFSTNPAASTNICVGGTYSPTAAASGSFGTISYQWQYSTTIGGTYTNVVNGTPAGATYNNPTSNNTFSVSGITAAGTYYYKCQATTSITNSGCTNPVLSTAGAVVVANQLVFTTNPSSINICTAGTYAPTVVTTGGQSVTYQWQYSTDNITFNNVVAGTPAGAVYTNPTSATTFTVTGITAPGTYYYQCAAASVGNGCTTPVNSSSGTVNVASQIAFTTNPSSANICVGGVYAPTVATTGGQSVTYQWQYCITSGGAYTNVVNGTPAGSVYANATSPTAFTVTGITAANTYYYKCVATAVGSGCTTPVSSTFGTLIVASQLAFATNPANANICVSGTYSPTASTTGGQSVTYQWQYSPDNITYTNVTAGTPTGAVYTNPTLAGTFSVSGITAAGTYYYKCQATAVGNNCTSPVLSSAGTLTVANQLVFATNPADANICVSGTYAPTVSTTGGQSVTYQWQYATTSGGVYANVVAGTPTGAVYTNPTSATAFTVNGITAAGTYYYKCSAASVGNACTTPVLSTFGTLSVAAQVVFATNPAATTNVCIGGTYSPTASTTGGQSVVYQWQYSTASAGTYNDVANGTPAGAVYTNPTSNNTFSVSGITAAGSYFYKLKATATGANCTSPVLSTAGNLVMSNQLAFSTNPADANICVGGTYAPTVAAAGGFGAITYQWQYATTSGGTYANVVNGTPAGSVYANATSATTFTVTGITAAGTYFYKCVATQATPGASCNNPVSSNFSTVNVASQLAFSTNPVNANICVNGVYAPTVVTTGGQNVTYQWQYATTIGGTYANVVNNTPTGAVYANATSASAFTVSSITAPGSYFYKCLASASGSSCTTSALSTAGTLNVAAQVVFGTNPANANICVGGTYSPTAASTGGQGVTYQWQYSTDNITFNNVANGTPTGATYSNATSASTFSVAGITAPGTYYYQCQATSSGNNCTTPVSSSTGTLNVASQLTFTTNPSDGNICVGGVYSPTVATSGGQAVTYQWQYATTSGGVYSNVANGVPTGATYSNTTSATTFSVSGISASGSYFYKCQASATGSSCTSPVLSTFATLNVASQVVFATNPASASICTGGTYSPTASTTGGQSVTYQWQYATTSGGTYNDVANGIPAGAAYSNPTSASTFSVTGISASGSYFYKLKATSAGNNCTSPVSSSFGTLTVADQPTIVVSGGDVSVCNGASVTLTGTPSGGTGTPSYQWQSATTSGGTYSNVATGGTSATYSPSTTTNGTLYYQVLISYSGTSCAANVPSTNNQFVTVNVQPTITVSGGDVNVCNGTSVTLTGTPSGGVGTPAYQWQSATTSGGTYSNVATGGTSATYNPVTTTNGTLYYRVTIGYSGSGCSSNVPSNNNQFVAVSAQPTITVSGGNTSVCNGVSVTLTGTPSGGTGTATYQWQSATTSGGTYSNVPTGGTSATYNPDVTTNGTLYYRVLVSYSGTGCSSNVPSTNNQFVTVNSIPGAVTVSGGGTYCAVATLTASGGSGGTIYYEGTTSGGTSTATASSSQVVNATGTYYFRAQSGAGCWGTEGSASVTIAAGPFTTSTWTGAVDGDWFNHNNWTQCVPGINTDVTIPVVGTGNYPNTYGSNPSVKSLTIDAGGATMTLNAARTLTVTNDVTINGNLTMSGSSIITMAGNFSSMGTLTGGNGTITFTGSSTSTITTNTSGSSFNHITVNKSSGAKVTMANDLLSNGTLTITNGVFEVPVNTNLHTAKVNNSSSGTVNVKAGARIDIP